jgi:hypothetical protein
MKKEMRIIELNLYYNQSFCLFSLEKINKYIFNVNEKKAITTLSSYIFIYIRKKTLLSGLILKLLYYTVFMVIIIIIIIIK